jgi:hypothetical protein
VQSGRGLEARISLHSQGRKVSKWPCSQSEGPGLDLTCNLTAYWKLYISFKKWIVWKWQSCKKSSKINHCLSLCSIAVKRHHDHGNSYKGKHFIEIGLVLEVQSLLSWWEAWWHTGRCGTGEVPESWTSGLAARRKRETLGLAWAFETPKPTPSDRLSPTRSQSLTVPLPMGKPMGAIPSKAAQQLTHTGIAHRSLGQEDQSAVGRTWLTQCWRSAYVTWFPECWLTRRHFVLSLVVCFMSVCFVCLCVCAPPCLVLVEVRSGHQIPWYFSKDDGESTCGCWELNQNPLQEQQIFFFFFLRSINFFFFFIFY